MSVFFRDPELLPALIAIEAAAHGRALAESWGRETVHEFSKREPYTLAWVRKRMPHPLPDVPESDALGLVFRGWGGYHLYSVRSTGKVFLLTASITHVSVRAVATAHGVDLHPKEYRR